MIKPASGTEPEGRIFRKVVLTNPCKVLINFKLFYPRLCWYL